jgi:hypothetical protein
MSLTGHAGGPPLALGVDLLALGQAAGGIPLPARSNMEMWLFGRAALLGLSRGGRRSAGRSCRIIGTADGWCAVSLARPEDLASLPAILEQDVDPDEAEAALAAAAETMPAKALADRAQLFGVPAAELGAARFLEAVRCMGRGEPGPVRDAPLVVDLSSLWAGPLCAHLLGLAGAEVIKVESAARPDGARSGNAAFFDWLHAGHASVVLDFGTGEDRAELRRLIDRADVVIEASRPRALRNLGIDAEEVVASGPGRTWVSITGYGREGEAADRVAFGDDAAVAGGLVAWDEAGDPVFCGDAVADPLSGLYAARAVQESMAAGGGRLLDVAMAGVAAHVADARLAIGEHRVLAVEDGWSVDHGGETFPVVPPRPPS